MDVRRMGRMTVDLDHGAKLIRHETPGSLSMKAKVNKDQ